MSTILGRLWLTVGDRDWYRNADKKTKRENSAMLYAPKFLSFPRRKRSNAFSLKIRKRFQLTIRRRGYHPRMSFFISV
jgi:hypothetical protein